MRTERRANKENIVRNHKVTAWLASPLAGEPPMLDAILGDELACRLGNKHHKKTGRWTPVEELEDLPIPLAFSKIDGYKICHCSAPILPKPDAEWTDNIAKRFNSSRIALLISPEHRKSVMTASGPYKSKFDMVRVRHVSQVCWFVRGSKEGFMRLLKAVSSIGAHRGAGYGQVWQWTAEEIEDDYSIFAPCKGKKVLMRPLPVQCNLDNVCGYRKSFGGWKPPYWHPGMQVRINTPC